ncbi:MAG TPA: hydroxymethylbilane synthase [Actinomycetota bacterium]|nr:hydroxymethylbilane synthase [Actinomycetota bacterium]
MKLRIGTRRSRLAMAQAEAVARALRNAGAEPEVVPMQTAGDRGGAGGASPAGLKGLWVSDIVRALREGEVDLAVHSAKDLPAEDEDGVALAAVPERASPLDVLITPDGHLPQGSGLGTSSLRRRSQVLRWRPDLRVVELRGNVDTRLAKLERGEVDGLVLAAAGLLRMGIVPEHAAPMSAAEMVPAPGQGCLGIQARSADPGVLEVLSRLDHRDSRTAFEAERRLVRLLGGGCALPLGAYARVQDQRVRLVAVVLTSDGDRAARVDVEATSPEVAADVAAQRLRSEGAEQILAEARA